MEDKKIVSLDVLNHYNEYVQDEFDYLGREVEEVGNMQFDGNIDTWNQLTDEEKETYLIASVEEETPELTQETVMSVNNIIGNDPQEEIVNDMFTDEIMRETNSIVEGGR